MAYKQAPRGNFKKTGHGLPPVFQQKDYDISTTAEGVLRAGGYKQAGNLVSKQGGVVNNPDLAAETVLRTVDSLNTVRKFKDPKVRELVGKEYDSNAPKKFSKSEVDEMKKKLSDITIDVKQGGGKKQAEKIFGK